MAEAEQAGRIGRSILAVIAGIIVAAVLSIGSDLVMHVLGYIPSIGERAPDGSLAVATIYRTIYGVLGAYVTAYLAPRRPMKHVMILGTLGLMVSIAGAAATWNKGPAFGPHWYPVGLVVLALPTAWAGGRWREIQLMKRPQEIG
jgi:peptidoglycan/LPS O-acetylase OafA/YrhL